MSTTSRSDWRVAMLLVLAAACSDSPSAPRRLVTRASLAQFAGEWDGRFVFATASAYCDGRPCAGADTASLTYYAGLISLGPGIDTSTRASTAGVDAIIAVRGTLDAWRVSDISGCSGKPLACWSGLPRQTFTLRMDTESGISDGSTFVELHGPVSYASFRTTVFPTAALYDSSGWSTYDMRKR